MVLLIKLNGVAGTAPAYFMTSCDGLEKGDIMVRRELKIDLLQIGFYLRPVLSFRDYNVSFIFFLNSNFNNFIPLISCALFGPVSYICPIYLFWISSGKNSDQSKNFEFISKESLIYPSIRYNTRKSFKASGDSLNAAKDPAEEGFENYRKLTRRELFLNEMDQVIPWRDLCKVIKPFYPKPKGAGCRSVGVERMLRIHFLQHWFNLSDPAVEEALCDSRAMRRFVGIDL